jgi:hypothetical protein
MSWQATDYAVELLRCPDGAAISALQKGFLLALAKFHNTKQDACFPNIKSLSTATCQSESHIKRHILHFREHGVLDYRSTRGRSPRVEYRFIELDGPFDNASDGEGPFFALTKRVQNQFR